MFAGWWKWSEEKAKLIMLKYWEIFLEQCPWKDRWEGERLILDDRSFSSFIVTGIWVYELDG